MTEVTVLGIVVIIKITSTSVDDLQILIMELSNKPNAVKSSPLKKTNRKNKLGVPVKYPNVSDGYFTIEDLLDLNKNKMPDITLRTKVRAAVERGELTRIGTINMGIGRPRVVFCMGKSTPAIISKAKENEVIITIDTDSVAKPTSATKVESFGRILTA